MGPPGSPAPVEHDPTVDAAPVPPVRTTPGMRPALLVGGIALVLVIVFAVAAGVTNGGQGSTKPLPTAARAVKGTSLLAVPATAALGRIADPGEPPANVTNAVTVPQHATIVHSVNTDQNAGLFDRSVKLEVSADQAAVIDFYSVEMRRLGWHVTSTGPATGQAGIEILGQKAGGDGWEWEMGTVVSPSSFSGSTDTTAFTIRLYQVDDED